MKKNFAKKLASVLSLAMVVTMVPAAPASAATAPNLAKRYTNVYEGKSYSYTVKDAKGYSVKWVVSGEGAEYADLTKTTGAKTTLKLDTNGEKAAKNSKVVVSAKFYKNNKLVKTAGDAVKVKVSATAVDAVTAANVDSIAVNEVADFNRTITPANATSVTYWSVTDKDGNATTDATIDKTGNFKATKVGEYVVVAEAKNAKNGVTIAKDTQAVKVVNKMSAVSQKSLDTISVTFTGNVKDAVKASDFTVKNAESLIKQAIKGVSFSEDGNTVDLQLYSELVNEKDYTVAYGDSTLTLSAKIGAPTRITVTGKTITFNEATAVDIKLFDENGVDVTSNANMARVTVSVDRGYYNNVDKKLTLYSVGDVANLTATYHTYTYGTDGKEIVYEAKATFTAVTKAAAEVSSIVSTITNGNPDWKNVTNIVALKDSAYKLVVKATYGDKSVKTTLDALNALTLESTDTTKLIIGTGGVLLPVSTGVVVVRVKSGDTVIGTVDVTVGAERKAYSAQLDKTSLTLSNSATAFDEQKVKLTVKDQYGVNMTDNSDAQVKFTGTGTEPAGAAVPTGNEVNFVGVKFTNAGTYTYTITYKGMTQSIVIVVKAPASNVSPSSIRLSLSSTEQDAAFTSETSSVGSKVDVKLFAYDASGVKMSDIKTGYTYDVKKSDGSTVVTGVAFGTGFDVRKNNAGVITQTAADTYTILAKNADGSVIDTATIKITNSQVLPVITQTSNKITGSAISDIMACFKANLNGTDKAITACDLDQVTGGNAVLVKTVTVPETITNGDIVYTINHVITVNAVVYTN